MVYIYKPKEDVDVIMVLSTCSLFIDQRIERVIVFIWYELLGEDRLNPTF